MSCNCVRIDLNVQLYSLQYDAGAFGSGSVSMFQMGIYNNFRWYLFNVSGQDYVIWYDNATNKFIVQEGTTPNNGGVIYLEWLNVVDIPEGSIILNEWVIVTPRFTVFTTLFIPQSYSFDVNISGTFGGNNYYQFTIEGVENYLYYGAKNWEFAQTLGGPGAWGAWKNSLPPCPPLGSSPVWLGSAGINFIETKDCDTYLIECLNFCYSVEQGPLQCIDVNIYDVDGDNAPTFVFEIPEYPGQQFKILLADYGAPFFFGWYLVTLGPTGDFVAYLENDGSFVDFPSSNAGNVYGWSQNEYFDFNTSQAKSCPIVENVCDCGISFNFTINGTPLPTITAETSGVYNGRNYYKFEAEFTPGFPVSVYCFWNGVQWQISENLGDPVPIALLYKNAFCPIGDPAPIEPDSFLNYWFIAGDDNTLKTEGASCTTCGREDRIFRQYDAVKLPDDTTDPNRGLKECCCENLVLASSSSNSWENDITSAWIKLTAGSTSTFLLLKNGEETNYTPTPQLFVNEPNAIYTTINWNDVLASDGPGCYELVIKYNISGILETLFGGFTSYYRTQYKTH